jgi:hypothetical protein
MGIPRDSVVVDSTGGVPVRGSCSGEIDASNNSWLLYESDRVSEEKRGIFEYFFKNIPK